MNRLWLGTLGKSQSLNNNLFSFCNMQGRKKKSDSPHCTFSSLYLCVMLIHLRLLKYKSFECLLELSLHEPGFNS